MRGERGLLGLIVLLGAFGAILAAGPAYAQEDVSYEYLTFPITPEVETFVEGLERSDLTTLLQLQLSRTSAYTDCLNEKQSFVDCYGSMNILYLVGYHLAIKNDDPVSGALTELNRLTHLYSMCLEEQEDLDACHTLKMAFDGVKQVADDLQS